MEGRQRRPFRPRPRPGVPPALWRAMARGLALTVRNRRFVADFLNQLVQDPDYINRLLQRVQEGQPLAPQQQRQFQRYAQALVTNWAQRVLRQGLLAVPYAVRAASAAALYGICSLYFRQDPANVMPTFLDAAGSSLMTATGAVAGRATHRIMTALGLPNYAHVVATSAAASAGYGAGRLFNTFVDVPVRLRANAFGSSLIPSNASVYQLSGFGTPFAAPEDNLSLDPPATSNVPALRGQPITPEDAQRLGYDSDQLWEGLRNGTIVSRRYGSN